MNYMRYVELVGTMHVSPESREEVRRTIEEKRPDAVALELDEIRLRGMIEGRTPSLADSLKMGRAGLLNYLLSAVERWMGKEFGMTPGQEMLTAYATASKLGIPVYLIDQDIRITLTRLLNAPVEEKIRIGADVISALLGLGTYGGEAFEDDVNWLMKEFRERYPYMHRVLIEERNAVMAGNIASIVRYLLMSGLKRPLVVAVVGMGHVRGVGHILHSGNIYKTTALFKTD
ncbi:MAG: conjugal transfer protein TraB [Thermococci archaeon]|nr:conjugal transfer protein TraB [Thermococci archaeon]